jgi:hypothetical protein
VRIAVSALVEADEVLGQLAATRLESSDRSFSLGRIEPRTVWVVVVFVGFEDFGDAVGDDALEELSVRRSVERG